MKYRECEEKVNMIKNIIFDLSEVIISGYYGVGNLMEKRYQISAEEFEKQKDIHIDLFLDSMRGKLTEEEYVRELIKGTNWSIHGFELKELIRENLNIPVKGTMDIIKKLKGDYKLILLSDHVREWVDYILENNKELSIFDEIFFSYELGKLKSDPNTFKLVLEKLGIKENETILIDDSKKNIDMAKEQGINGILFINAEQLKQKLNDIL